MESITFGVTFRISFKYGIEAANVTFYPHNTLFLVSKPC